MEAVIQRLLDPEVLTAKQIYRKHERAIRALCKEYKVTKLIAFGSRARGDARPDSDLDLLVSLAPGADYFESAGILVVLQDLLGMKVDVVVDGPHLAKIRPEIERDAVILFGG